MIEFSEHSDSTATSESQERLIFLRGKSAYIEKKVETVRGYLIDFNNKRINNVKKQVEEFKAKSHQNLKSRMTTFLEKAKMSDIGKDVTKKLVEDPREGITRRYANYTPINRYQYMEDTVHVFYPNVSDKFHKKLTEEWKVARKNMLLNHRIVQDMTLCMYMAKFGDSEEAVEIYKKFQNTECENKTIRHLFKELREKYIKKKTVFQVPGCSVTSHEEMNEHTIIKTHKELFCRRCEVYDCGLHGILDFSNFISPNLSSGQEMIASYLEMMALHASREKRAESNKQICGLTCFCAPVQINIEMILDDFVTSKIKLALQIFKFDPCSIKLYFHKDEITCSQIFRYLKSEFTRQHSSEENAIVLDDDQHEIIPHKKGIKRLKNKKDIRYFFPNWKNLKESLSGTIAIDYRPCYHSFHNHPTTEEEQHCMNKNCACFERGLCDKYCGCDIKKCTIRRKGCDCATSCMTSVCPCAAINTECDPDLCKCCFNIKGQDKTNNCQNQMIYFGNTKQCRVGPSDVCSGLGLFTLVPIKKGEFVYNYIGELISWEEADVREKWNKYDPETYLCTVSDEYVVDAKYRGNKARFINHGKDHANLVARNVSSEGLYYFCFFAKCDIDPGSELLFDYEGGGSALKEQYEWIAKPLIPKTIKSKELPTLPPSEGKEVYLHTGVQVYYEPQIQIKIKAKVKKLKKIELINLEDDLVDAEDMGYISVGSDEELAYKRRKKFAKIKEELQSEPPHISETEHILNYEDGNNANDELFPQRKSKNDMEEPRYSYIFDIRRENSSENSEDRHFIDDQSIKNETSRSENEAVETDEEHILNG